MTERSDVAPQANQTLPTPRHLIKNTEYLLRDLIMFCICTIQYWTIYIHIIQYIICSRSNKNGLRHISFQPELSPWSSATRSFESTPENRHCKHQKINLKMPVLNSQNKKLVNLAGPQKKNRCIQRKSAVIITWDWPQIWFSP